MHARETDVAVQEIVAAVVMDGDAQSAVAEQHEKHQSAVADADPEFTEVKACQKAANKAYRDRPEVKAANKAYRDMPEVKARRIAYQKAYRDRPEVKAYMKAYLKA